MVAAVEVGAHETQEELECRRSCVVHVNMAAHLAEEVVNDTGERGCCSSGLFYGTSEALVRWGKPSRNPTIGVEGSSFRVVESSFVLATNCWVLSPSSAPAGKYSLLVRVSIR